MKTQLALAGCLVVAAMSCADDPAEGAKKKVLDQLQGEWKAEKLLVEGKNIADNLQNQTFLFKGKEIIVRENGTDTDNKLKFEIDVGAQPPLIDLENKDGDKLEGIFELKEDRLKICVSLQKGNRPTEFASPADSMIALAEMKRVKN